jgi:oxaloacetate decarboxylase alpha subunit
MRRPIELVDTTLRDGNQSIWGATGLTTQDVLAIAPVIDRVGYRAIDFTTSTHMAVSVRFHRENPWERLRLARAVMPDTPLGFLTTGTRFISWRPAAADVLQLAFECIVRAGIRRFQIMHPANDATAQLALASMARRAGAEEIVLALTYTISPVHGDDWFADRIASLTASPDADRFYLKDPGGLLVPERARSLVTALVHAAGGRPVEVHSHCTTGLAPVVYLAATEAGAQAVHTAVGPLASGSSQPQASSTLRDLVEAGFTHEIDETALVQTADYFTELAGEKGLPTGVPLEYDHTYYRHQLPGGMVSTTRRQLEDMRRPELFAAALEEVARVRAELGYPIMVTPFSQFVTAQAVMNVLGGERYATVPDEVVRFMLGQFGPTATPPDSTVVDRVLSLPRAAELRTVEPLSLDGARKRFGTTISDEELLLRLTMPSEQVDAMLQAPATHAETPLARPGRATVVRLLRELERRPSITYLRLQTDDDLVEWRRAGVPDAP